LPAKESAAKVCPSRRDILAALPVKPGTPDLLAFLDGCCPMIGRQTI
jgi:hypothetical protein